MAAVFTPGVKCKSKLGFLRANRKECRKAIYIVAYIAHFPPHNLREHVLRDGCPLMPSNEIEQARLGHA